MLNFSRPIDLRYSVIASPFLSICFVTPSKVTVILSPCCLAITPNCFNISISPVVALNAACANWVMLFPIPAAKLPKSSNASLVGIIPACFSVINDLATSSIWKVVVDVNALINSKDFAAASALPVTALKVASKSSKVLLMLTTFPSTAPAPTAIKADFIFAKPALALLVVFFVLSNCLFTLSKPLRSCFVSARISNTSWSTVLAINQDLTP